MYGATGGSQSASSPMKYGANGQNKSISYPMKYGGVGQGRSASPPMQHRATELSQSASSPMKYGVVGEGRSASSPMQYGSTGGRPAESTGACSITDIVKELSRMTVDSTNSSRYKPDYRPYHNYEEKRREPSSYLENHPILPCEFCNLGKRHDRLRLEKRRRYLSMADKEKMWLIFCTIWDMPDYMFLKHPYICKYNKTSFLLMEMVFDSVLFEQFTFLTFWYIKGGPTLFIPRRGENA